MNQTNSRQLLRQLPSVDQLLRHPAAAPLLDRYGRSQTTDALRHRIEDARAAILDGEATAVDSSDAFISKTSDWLQQAIAPTLHGVINATGVIVHTNLGRAPLSKKALTAVSAVGGAYSTLEYDIESGKRGSRAVHAAQMLSKLTGAEAALAVNNNASAVLLMLTALCKGKEVIISRGQLVEIGGGFRIPDVMAQSGAALVEVGTTNRTHLRDYEAAINENTAAILVAHPSNYKVIGFTTAPAMRDLAALARERGVMLLYDQGSGALLDTAVYGLDLEPTIGESVRAGADLVAFSGDKLLGGPQAGILCGKADLIAAIKRHPLARAVRADKMALAALAATLESYANGRAPQEIPVWQMISRPLEDIAAAAAEWAARWGAAGLETAVIDGASKVGGGSLPGSSLPTKLVAIACADPDQAAADLRNGKTAVIGRIQDGCLVLDPRTVLPGQEEKVLSKVAALQVAKS